MLTGLDAFLDRGGAFVKLLVRLAERGAGNRTGHLRFHGEAAGVVPSGGGDGGKLGELAELRRKWGCAEVWGCLEGRVGLAPS